MKYATAVRPVMYFGREGVAYSEYQGKTTNWKGESLYKYCFVIKADTDGEILFKYPFTGTVGPDNY